MTTRIGKYEVGTQLGNGGFGVVYTGRDIEAGREVAIKILRSNHAADDSVVARFLQEARAAAAIRHPGIAAVYDAGVIDGHAYLAMELLRGTSLTQRLREHGRLDATTAIDIARQLASVLQAAHEAGIIHRDLKPDNVIVLPGDRVKLLDFGIAKLGTSVHTQTEIVLGTPRYMSPEQGRSAAKVDARSDIYALGCMLYELVCGSAPFTHADPFELIAQHQYMQPRAPRALEPSVPESLERLILWMLEKSPDARPASMSVVVSALAAALEAPSAAAVPVTVTHAVVAPLRRRFAVAAVACAVSIAVSWIGYAVTRESSAMPAMPSVAAAPERIELQVETTALPPTATPVRMLRATASTGEVNAGMLMPAADKPVATPAPKKMCPIRARAAAKKARARTGA